MRGTFLAAGLVLAAMTHMVEGTVMTVELNPPRLMANVSRQFQTYGFAAHAVIERESCSRTEKIPLSDLTPGEFVKLDLDGAGHVTRAHAIANVETAKVRAVNGNDIVLEDGRTFTIGSVLRFTGKRRARAGDSVLLFHHPQTNNVYRISEAAAARRKR